MKILVSNVGSTSLKFKLFEMPEEKLLCESRMESVGSTTDGTYYYYNVEKDASIRREKQAISDYTVGIHMFLSSVVDPTIGVISGVDELAGIGFKTVLAKGYYGTHLLTDEVLKAMEEYLFVAPAHNGPYLEAIAAFRAVLPSVPMVGVFETAFHTTIPLERRMYAIPYEWYETYGIMRLGYHGASHGYIAREVAARFGSTGKLISCHLGGSCSLCAIEDGKSVDTSFGFSLQTGIPHANRCGDVDPYIVPFLLNEGLSMDAILQGMGKQGGLLGVSGVSNDLRKVEAAAAKGNERAELAIGVLVCAIVRYIGSFYAELGGLDRLVFTGGIGENSHMIRRRVCAGLSHLGIVLDETRNMALKGSGIISAEVSPVTVLVLPTNEEIGIARQTYEMI